MSHATDPQTTQRAPAQERRSASPPTPSGWVEGSIGFAAVMMMLLGAMHAVQGLVAIFRDDYYLVSKSGLMIHVNYTTWGWVQLIGGALVFAAGIGVLSGRIWARIVGVVLAMLSALLNIAFLSAYPLWSTIMIAVDIVVIWALTVHGAEMRSD